MMLILGFTGIAVEYWSHHSTCFYISMEQLVHEEEWQELMSAFVVCIGPAKAAKEAHKEEGHGHGHH
jgi:hypothetical protein